MACDYCYIPFDKSVVDFELCKDICHRLSEVGFEEVTFGGGDPFLYPEFLSFLERVRGHFRFVQVDTNGLGMERLELGRIQGVCDLIGLPLDGPTAKVHAEMRGGRNHFGHVLELAHGFAMHSLRTKINTVVGRPNIRHLPKMPELIAELKPAVWSIYQFWPIGPIAYKNSEKYQIGKEEFAQAVAKIEMPSQRPFVEIGSTSDRKDCYFFVNNLGKCYTVDPLDQNSYRTIGDIFDENIVEKWQEFGYAKRNLERIQVRRNTLGCDL